MTSPAFTRIESDANARFKRWKKLALESRSVKKEGATLCEGAHLVMCLLERPEVKVTAILVDEKHVNEEAQALLGKLQDLHPRAPLYTLMPVLYNTLSPVEHGVGLMVEIDVPKVDKAAKLTGDILYLDGVQDAGNAGTLIRTAVAAGVKTIVASPQTVLLWTPKVLRAAMGAHFGAKILEDVTIETFCDQFSGTICVADARGGEDLFATTTYPKGETAWVMGAEGPGVSERALELSDRRFYIPIEADCESLNVAAAGAVCLFEQRRRRLVR